MTPSPLPTPRRARRTALTLPALALTLVVSLPSAATAEPDEVDIDELTERAEELEESYEGELLQFTEIRDRVERAEDDLAEIEERLNASRSGVSVIASSRYKTDGFLPSLQIVFSSEPERMFTDAATVAYLSESQSAQITDLVEIHREQEEVTAELNDELAEAAELVETLEEQREEVEERIREYEESQVPETPGNGTIPDSARGGGWDSTTPRMAAIRDNIIMAYGAPYPVGCWRPSADDHGDGRACDFMMSSGGAMPSSENQALGDQIAQHAINNAAAWGVDYVIWRQRIWQQSNPQWVFMNDRGDNTQNHYDHVHISSY
ncbi:coiled-coil domain-containing protein [Nocardiopsis sp. NPDC050513]|uniref:coiled-coil domain-containing protein n=1 Tax=Nocardiopsis sp. NPDC050513 TaxID=3364338 RepID=UPI0037BA70D2